MAYEFEDPELTGFTGITRLFPLGGVVMFPHAVLPLHIFEPRYRQMTEHALASDSFITIVQSKPGNSRNGVTAIESVGCLGRIIHHERLPDGRFHLLLHGRSRVRITEELTVDTLYRQAQADVMEDLRLDGESDGLRQEILALLRQDQRFDEKTDALLSQQMPLGALCDLLAHASRLSPAQKQELLECIDPRTRARELLAHRNGHRADASGGGTPRNPWPPPISLN